MYVGGGKNNFVGWGSKDNRYRVMEYDISTKQWTKLPQYIARYFSMVVIYDQLVLVGGKGDQKETDKLGVWEADRKEWIYPYPQMPTARYMCSAVVYGSEWLVVIGGETTATEYHDLSTVEVFNFSTGEWCDGPRAPVPMSEMQTAVVRGTCYFMGGFSGGDFIDLNGIHTMTLPALVDYITSKDPRSKRVSKRQIWNKIPGMPFTRSNPVCVGGSLLTVGGELTKNDWANAVQDILLYQHDKLEWLKIGDLPSHRLGSVCVMVSERELFMAGGEDFNCIWQPATYFALINSDL